MLRQFNALLRQGWKNDKVPRPQDVLRICRRLAESSLVQMQQPAKMPFPRLLLGCQIEDVAIAVQDDEQLTSILPVRAGYQ